MQDSLENSTFSVVNKENFDLIVYQCGMEKCNASHSYGPAVRDHFLIHFIIEGKGCFYVDNKCYKLEKNQGFLICPDIVTYYEADSKSPWEYAWIGFKGVKAESYLKQANLDRSNLVFAHPDGIILKSCFDDMRKAAKLRYGADLRLQGILGVFLSELIEIAEKQQAGSENFKDVYIKKVLQFIETNYSRDISISDISQHIGLNKNYFSSFFKENLHMTPQEYLIKYRINKACELMKNKNLTVAEISCSVGYTDSLCFSKIFKKVKGCCPREYMKRDG